MLEYVILFVRNVFELICVISGAVLIVIRLSLLIKLKKELRFFMVVLFYELWWILLKFSIILVRRSKLIPPSSIHQC